MLKSIKNTDTAKNKVYNAGKKVSGIIQYIAVVTPMAWLHVLCMYITTSDVNDRHGSIEMIGNHNDNLSQVQNILVDAGYSGEKFANSVSEILELTIEVVKPSEMHIFKVIPKKMGYR